VQRFRSLVVRDRRQAVIIGAVFALLPATALIYAQQPPNPANTVSVTSEIVLHNFACPPKGATPYAGVIRDSAGDLYGTTYQGGTANAGVVYKLSAAGKETILYSFTGGADGANPYAGVILDSAGNLYGTTSRGGTPNAGVVFKLTAGKETILYSFTGGADGANPYGGVIRDSAGNLYGTTYQGGAANSGVVYKVDATGQETVLYSFGQARTFDGRNPSGGVVRDSAGNLYGTTTYGGYSPPCPEGCGTVYMLNTNDQETVLYNFLGSGGGANPYSGVVLDSAGNLYGTTSGGANDGYFGPGVLYKLNATGQETVLYSFTGGADGGSPYAGVIRDSAGNLYGTTYNGGTGTCYGGCGVVYKLDVAGNEEVLYNFTGGPDGSSPLAGVALDSAGNLYGTTQNGGSAANAGVVYELDATGQETALYSFAGAGDGAIPYAGVVRDSAGNLYGTTYQGGTANAGVVYKLGAAGKETILYSFTGGADGADPYAGVILDSAGNLYGTTVNGGAAGAGVVYKVATTGQETILYSFTGGADGANPYARVIFDSAGNLYGTTVNGGAAGAGVVYKVATTGQETVLYSFKGGTDGGGPSAGVIRDSAGNLYGTTYYGGTADFGVIYKLDTTGHETVLYSLPRVAEWGPGTNSGVVRDSAGNLYGTTAYGGASGAGVVYKVATTGQETVLYSFTGGADGANPYAGVILDSVGNLYGTSEGGGTASGESGYGVVFELNATGTETVLHAFTGTPDGAKPYSGVIRDSAGDLYGTTYSGGKATTGVVFKLKPQ